MRYAGLINILEHELSICISNIDMKSNTTISESRQQYNEIVLICKLIAAVMLELNSLFGIHIKFHRN